jgi:predicted  nucleic acid-binding Zn-ribbon protein
MLEALKSENQQLKNQVDHFKSAITQLERDLKNSREVEMHRAATIRQLEWQLQSTNTQFKRIEERQETQVKEAQHLHFASTDSLQSKLNQADFKIRAQEEHIN